MSIERVTCRGFIVLVNIMILQGAVVPTTMGVEKEAHPNNSAPDVIWPEFESVTRSRDVTDQWEKSEDYFGPYPPDGPQVLTCSETQCPKGSTCVSDGYFTFCECPPGKVGPNCDLDDPCVETKENCPPGMACYGPCSPNVFCIGSTGIPQCTNCIEGYTGDGCESDEDECTEYFDDVCNNNGNCTNTFGGFICTCFAGFTGLTCDEHIEDYFWPNTTTEANKPETKKPNASASTPGDTEESTQITWMHSTVISSGPTTTESTLNLYKKTTSPYDDQETLSEILAPSKSSAAHYIIDLTLVTLAFIVTMATRG